MLFVRQKPPLTRLFLIQNAGIGLNNAVPVRVVSEGAQFALPTLRYRVKGGVALGTLGMERILDLVVTAAAGTFAFAIVYVLKAFGVSQALAFSYAVVIHAVLFLPPIVIAILVFSSIGLKPLTNRGGARPAEEITVASIHDQKRRTQ